MALVDYHNTGADSQSGFHTVNWRAQTFTASENYTVASVRVLLHRQGSPGIATLSIKATSSSLPTGGDLASGTADLDSITTLNTGEWVEFDLGAGTSLSTGVEYAIVIRGGTDSSNRGLWNLDSDNGYANGQLTFSGNSGGSWSASGGADFLFETYTSSVTFSELSGTIAVVSTVTGNMVLGTTVELAGTIAVTTTVTGNMVLSTISELSGTIAAQSTVGPSSLGSTTVGITTKTSYIKRLVAAGNNQIWYEDI